MKLQLQKDWNVGKKYFEQIIACDFWVKNKTNQMNPKLGFLSLWGMEACHVSIFLDRITLA